MDMDKLVALCRRRGFLFQSSEIYGGLNGFWDYGPLGVELKRNIREAWWRDMVTGHNELAKPTGATSTFEMVGIDCSIIMHPQVWKCSGHYDLFHDMMVDCRETKVRYRADHLICYPLSLGDEDGEVTGFGFLATTDSAELQSQLKSKSLLKRIEKAFGKSGLEVNLSPRTLTRPLQSMSKLLYWGPMPPSRAHLPSRASST